HHGSNRSKIYRCRNCLHRHGRCRRRRGCHLRSLPRRGTAQSVRRTGTIRQPDFRIRRHRSTRHLFAADRAPAPLRAVRRQPYSAMATTAHTQAPSEHKGAFPPFDSSTFASQLVWLVITFVLLYALMAKVALPRVGSIIAQRQNRIDDDLAQANAFKAQSDAALGAYEKALADARARAQAMASEMRDKQAAEAEASRKKLEDQLNAKLAEAEKVIAGTKQAAMANVRNIAADAARAIVERLIGTVPADSAVVAAVKD